MDRSVHLVVIQFKPRKGDYAANLGRLAGIFSQIDSLDPRPDVAVFAETALTGYFVEGGVRDVALTAGALARDLQTQYASAITTPRKLDVCIGFYEVWNNAFYNSALYVTLGGEAPFIRHVHRKLFLPTYGLFDEERFVDRGFEVRAFDTDWGRAAMLICEDAWHSLTGTVAALDGATMVFVVSASPARGVWPRDDEGQVPADTAMASGQMRHPPKIQRRHALQVPRKVVVSPKRWRPSRRAKEIGAAPVVTEASQSR